MNLGESVDRLLEEGALVARRFYGTLFERHPELKPLFEHVSLSTQSVMLTAALASLREHPDLKRAARMYLNVLGSRHREANVPREFFGQFTEVLIATIAEFHGNEWSDGLARQWREAFDDATRLMFEGYDRTFHV